MKKGKVFKNIGLLLVVIGTILFTIETSYAYVISFSQDKAYKETIIDSINEEYQEFKENIELFKEEAEKTNEFYNQYFEGMSLANENQKTILENVDKIVKDGLTISKKLSNYCSFNHNQESIINKCNSIEEIEEKLVESYSNVIEQYNSTVEKYNDWAKQTKKKTLDNYSPINYNDIININI